MCCIIQSSEQIAKEDIVCYKILKEGWDNYFISVYQGFPYFPGKRNHTDIKLIRHYENFGLSTMGSNGFHSLQDLKSAEQYYKASWRAKNHIMECTIPKGSVYYTGLDDTFYLPNYLSSDIIIIKEIKFNFKMRLWLLKKRIFG